jgi:hypothetical protein
MLSILGVSLLSYACIGTGCPHGQRTRIHPKQPKQRIADIIGRMTLEEKAPQLNHLNAGIPRLKVAMEAGETKGHHDRASSVSAVVLRCDYAQVHCRHWNVQGDDGSSADDIRLRTDLEID